MRSLTDALAGDPVLLAFAVIGIAAALGSLKVKGISLGPAAALFVGLAVGAVDTSFSSTPGLDVLRELGLVLFTYTVGLSSGPVFFGELRRGGARAVAATIAMVVALAGMCAIAGSLLHLSAADRAGLFAGSGTNTPALQAASEVVTTGNPVVAYSLTYPFAVAAMLVVTTLVLRRRLRLPPRLDPPPPAPRAERLVNWTIQVTSEGLPDLAALQARHPGIGFSRVEHDGAVSVATEGDRLVAGDAVVVVGPEPAVAAFAAQVGERSDRHLPLDRAVLDFRRMVVSNRRLAGRRLGDLNLLATHGIAVTRVRRGDDDLVAHDDLALQLGDRVRVVGATDRIAAAATLFGDSERRLGEVDAVGFALGIALGLALGALSLPLPGGGDLKLGIAGGPLVAGLLLGVASRTGPITWQIPHGANLLLRQLGILMFLACAGLASGSTFADAIGTRRGAELVAAGIVISSVFAGLVPLVASLVLHRNSLDATGVLAGVETQPAVLAFANERTAGDERVSRAYALVFPAAMIAKIVVVQFLAR